MTINYKELFDLAYSTRISETLKEEILAIVELPIQESTVELPQDIYESIYFLDNLAYSNMSEELANEIIDRVFEGCSEEFLNDILEAYVQVKAYEYITEGAAPIGLAGIARENRDRERAQYASERRKHERALQNQKSKQAIGKAVNDFRTKATEIGGKAKEGIKAAVGKVKDWYKKVTQDRPIGLAKMTGYKAQNKPVEQPKTETAKVEIPKLETEPIEQPKSEPPRPKRASKKVTTKVSKSKEEATSTPVPEPETEAKAEVPKPKKSKSIKIVDKVVKKKVENQEPTKDVKAKTPKPTEQSKPEPSKKASKKVTSKITTSKEPSVDEIIKGKMTGKEKSEKANELSYNRMNQDKIKYHKKAIKDYDMEIAAAEGKPAMMSKLGEIRQKREEHIKALEKLQAKV